MVKVDVCIETFFTQFSYEERIKKVAAAGYRAIEFWFHDYHFDGKNLIPKEKNIKSIAKVIDDLGLEVSDMVVNSPEGNIGGSLVKPEDKNTYLSRLKKVIELAHLLNCKKLITCTGNSVEGKSKKEQIESIVDTLTEASKVVERENITLILEPLNSLVDHPGYFLDSFKEAATIARRINHPNIRLLYDIYHMQIMEGNILSTIKQNIDIIGHFHSAGVPGRHELSRGELNYPFIYKEISEMGYNGYFGLEYWPSMDSDTSLKETRDLLGVQ
ncbi:glyoxylate-induced protein [Candidatus Aerophobetes bacterium]|uniref:Glyoxylate-induced protein n=1 Tax=Aerophobetes bacterium TaxID=2030807 RepID=A0A662DGF5_UNCAE|nr:MAG: glyoxylate-induced protein [Candidatus Aerophobetes bacterium]